jgi:hypothetical protein
MIATALVEEVRRMLKEGRLSQREIAQRTGVSRGSVNAIAMGKRRDNSTRRREHGENDGFTPPSGLPSRCPGCGGLAQMPCLLCYIREKTNTRKSPRPHLSPQPNRGNIAARFAG